MERNHTITLFGDKEAIVVGCDGVRYANEKLKSCLKDLVAKEYNFVKQGHKFALYDLVRGSGVKETYYVRYICSAVLATLMAVSTKEQRRAALLLQGGLSLDLLDRMIQVGIEEAIRENLLASLEKLYDPFREDNAGKSKFLETPGAMDLFIRWGRMPLLKAFRVWEESHGHVTCDMILKSIPKSQLRRQSPRVISSLVQRGVTLTPYKREIGLLEVRLGYSKASKPVYYDHGRNPYTSDRSKWTRFQCLSLRSIARVWPMQKVLNEQGLNIMNLGLPKSYIGRLYQSMLLGESSVYQWNWLHAFNRSPLAKQFLLRNLDAFTENRVVRGIPVRAMLDEMQDENIPESLGLRVWLQNVVVQREQQQRERRAKYEIFPFSQFQHPLKGVTKLAGWSVTHCQNDDMIAHEGIVMRHCVGGYIAEVQQGTYAVYHLEKDKLSATLGMQLFKGSWNLNQVHGVCNSLLEDEAEISEAIKDIVNQ